MRLRNHLIIPMLAALLAGCGTPKAPPPTVNMDHLPQEQLDVLEEIKIYGHTKMIKRPFDNLGIIQGVSCKSSTFGRAATKRDAILQARYQAQKIGADAILYLQCNHQGDTPSPYECSESVTCNGEAIKFK